MVLQDRSFGEIDVLFEAKVPARKFKYTKADRKLSRSPMDVRRALTFQEFAGGNETQEKEAGLGDRKMSSDHLEHVHV